MSTTVYGKLIKARKKFRGTGKEKTGKNEFSHFAYFQLSDFLYDALEAFDEQGLCGVVSFAPELATLSIVDIETGESIKIESPMSTAKLTACHEVQNLGAVQTYLRRYLWSAALELIEADPVEASPPASPPDKSEPPKGSPAPLPTRPRPTSSPAKADKLLEGEEELECVIDTLSETPKTSKAGKPYHKWEVTLDNGEEMSTIERAVGSKLHEGEIRLITRKDKYGTTIVKVLDPKKGEEAPKEVVWQDEITNVEETANHSGKWRIRFFTENDDGWTKDQEVAINAVSFEEHSTTVKVTGKRDKNGHLWVKSLEALEEEDANV